MTPDFEALVKSNAAKFTGEYVVLEVHDRFPKEAVAAARGKLEVHGVQLPPTAK